LARPVAYVQAVDATQNIGQANVQLAKTIRTNKSAQKYLLIFLFIACFCLLFLDWFYS
jgi:hypothetical protein